ncbi:acetyltransferase [Chryseobacterium sp.]|uniref:acetyltransferase n=1 Tax=Chryseobacterium sp. TaxID=1871047 RepID=UPI00388D627B
MKNIAIIGAGGFGQEVFCIWRDMLVANKIDYNFIGFFDDNNALEANVFGEIVGSVDSLNKIDYPIEVAIAIGNPKILNIVRNKLNNPNLIFPNIIHPSALLLDENTTMLGEGNILSLGVIFSCNCIVGNFNIFNTRSTLGHDNLIGDFNVFSPNVQISGSVKIENENFFGFNCGVIQGKKIGNRNTIGTSSILLRSIKDGSTYFGVPAVKIKF